MQGGRVTLQPAPIEEARARFMNIGASIAPFLPPATDAVKSRTFYAAPKSTVGALTDWPQMTPKRPTGDEFGSTYLQRARGECQWAFSMTAMPQGTVPRG
jgi:hypothetical protein